MMGRIIEFLTKNTGFSRLFASNIITNLSYFVSLLLLGIVLSTKEFGYFRVTYSYAIMAISVSMLGLNIALTHKIPSMSADQKGAGICLSVVCILIVSICVGILLSAVSPFSTSQNLQTYLLTISFILIVFGASMANLALSVFQADGELVKYAKFQMIWKSGTFGAAVIGAISGYASVAICVMSMSYFVLLYVYRVGVMHFFAQIKCTSLVSMGPVIRVLCKSALWPFVTASVAVIYSNLEFLFLSSEQMENGFAGSYSYASLVFVGGSALFLPFQTYAGSRIVNKRMTLKSLLRLQGYCFIGAILVAACAYFGANLLQIVAPSRFDQSFPLFVGLVCVKLVVWGSYAVTGSVLNFIGRGFEAFAISALNLFLISSIGLMVFNGAFEAVLVLQIIFGFVSLLIISALVIIPYKGGWNEVY